MPARGYVCSTLCKQFGSSISDRRKLLQGRADCIFAKATTLLHKVNLFDQVPPFLFSSPFTVSIFVLQRALPIRIMTVGKKRSPGVQLIVDEYIEKLKHYCRVEDVRIKSNPKNARDVMAQIEHEDIAVMGLIKSDEWVVMLDERGINMGSEQMASLIGDAGNTGASSILFCIGGPYGHGRQLRERADVSIKLSSLVLNHEVALVVLVEQLYRAWTILKGQKYHH
ncbi:putative RNA methyltransferase [Sesamum angolense]|uniref:RNA methyltransferase n=1 Tax=Sesamum angolense TaxID=2727404 RepID=A0AAE1W974_9LAMI|nr:putative RNA methyltransferase [Sesamum angolense]